MARRSRVHELAVGLVVLLALVLLAGAILVIGQESRVFTPKVTYRTNFTDASGLRVGSPVTMAGVRVGTVRKIVLPTDPRSEGIEVFLAVDRAYAPRVRQGTTASLVYLQFVANEKAVDLTPGDPNRPPLREGDFIPPVTVEPILETGRTIADTVEQITSDLRDILGAIREGKGLLGKAIVDPEFGKQGIEKLDQALDAANRLLQRVDRGEGLLGKLVADEEFAAAVARDLREAADGLAAMTRNLEEGKGLLGALTAPGREEELLSEVERTVRSLRQLSEALEEGKGLLGVLLRDEELADRVAGRLDEVSARLASILRKIDEGNGTLALLLNDPAVHDELLMLLHGVRSSKTATWLVRRYRDKGEKGREQEIRALRKQIEILEKRLRQLEAAPPGGEGTGGEAGTS